VLDGQFWRRGWQTGVSRARPPRESHLCEPSFGASIDLTPTALPDRPWLPSSDRDHRAEGYNRRHAGHGRRWLCTAGASGSSGGSQGRLLGDQCTPTPPRGSNAAVHSHTAPPRSRTSPVPTRAVPSPASGEPRRWCRTGSLTRDDTKRSRSFHTVLSPVFGGSLGGEALPPEH
jgi:hypothetical protein